VDDPYLRCGLRANPFAHGAGGPQDEAGWVDRGLPSAAPPGQCRLVQVIGVKGAGKSSTLRRWHAAVPGPWRYVPPGMARLRPLPVAPLVYWDEADRAPAALRRWAWRKAVRRRATVVVGTHVDLESEARAAGLAVHSVLLPALTAGELTLWAAERFAAVSVTVAVVGADPGWSLPGPVAADIALRAGASWRVAGDLLHVWVAQEILLRG
jgi:hypothetical protein